MLHFIRERAQGWVAWFIVGLISIPFALWGVNSYLTGGSEVVIAEVNGEEITQPQFQQSLQQYRDRMRQVMAEKFDPSQFDTVETKRQILDNLIQEKLLVAASQTLNQQISDEQIGFIIRSTEAFQTDGQFDSQRYKMQLQRAGYSTARYEAELRADLLKEQLTSSIQATAIVTNASVNTLLRLEKQQRVVEYGTVAVEPFKEQVELSEEELVLFYQDNKEEFSSPERISVDYVELSLSDLAEQVTFEEAELKQFYQDNETQFVSPEQRKASHILIEEDDTKALSVLDIIQEKLAAGESFEDLAKEYSSDTGSSSDGGDLGFIEKGVMGSIFEDALFDLQEVGDVSEPIRTEFGYHLIKLTAIDAPIGKSFVDARDEVEAAFRKQQAERLFIDQAELLADISYENPDDLSVVAEDLALEVKTTDPFTREGGAGIAANPKVVTMAFSDDVINDLNSAVIEVSRDHLVVLHKKRYIEESQLSFEIVSDIIAERLKSRHARKLAKEEGETLIEQLKAGTSPQVVFAAGSWQEAVTLSRTNQQLNSELVDHAFKMVKPDAEPVISGFTASNGNYVVVKLSNVIEADISSATEDDKAGLKAYLARYNGNTELQAFLTGLRNSADIVIRDEKLN